MTTDTLARLEAADAEFRKLKKSLEARLRKQLETELSAAKGRRDLIAYVANQEEGHSIASMLPSFHTTDRRTAYDSIAAGKIISVGGEVVADVDGEIAVVTEFTATDAGTIIIRPAAGTLAPLLSALGHDDPTSAPTEAEFQITGGRLTAVTPSWTPESGRNPVVALVQGEDATYRTRVLDWARSMGLAA
ncbi:hypothetical protein BKA24_001779 [Microbacterium marinum]|uniref:Uncharacterized protein n=1 Tax=Microbacterium marinum TaxID=421115 RepID=A0A7W7FJ50_9MICO|nr:hypothetical protein [Microbacterium marinum]MBB4667070.1 hypothetical protein [Microbacterium marinum]